MSGEQSVLPALTAAISAIGSDDHVDRLIDLIAALVLHDKVAVVRYSATQRPEFLSWRNYSPEIVRKYLESYYVFDPFYAGWRQNRRPGVVRLRAGGPEARGPYVADFLGESDICDELGVMLEDGDDWCLGIFLDRSRQKYSPAEVQRLENHYPVVAALHAQDIRLRAPGFRRTGQTARPGREPGLTDSAGLPDGLWPDLTARERELVGMTVAGHPPATIARRMAITTGTVKNHRRNIYRKLDITTERELFLQYILALTG
ncbi:MAG: helix-turn-helix transcriptional regulator [Paracoccaceae bacterium]